MGKAVLSRPITIINRLGARQKRAAWVWIILLPTLVYFLVFQFIPMFIGMYMSLFQGMPLMGSARFTGLQNFYRILTRDRLSAHSLWVTVVYVIDTVTLSNMIGLFLALLMNRDIWGWGRNAARTTLYFPQMLPGVVIALIFSAMMDPHTGVLNVLLGHIGIGPIRWLQSSGTAMLSMILITVWHGMGYRMVIYLAGLQGIPEDYYDAAKIDGATGMAELWYITLPLLRDTIIFNTVTAIISAFQTFDLPFIMTGGGPANATRLYAYHIYQTAFDKLNFGYASALSMILFMIIFTLSLIQLRAGRERLEYY